MSVGFYLDEQVPRAIASALRARGVDALTAPEDHRAGASDPEILDRATQLGRLLVTFDEDFLKEGSIRQQEGRSFSGIAYAHQLRCKIGRLLDELELMAKAGYPEDFRDHILYLRLGSRR